jgi:hypothetical protein
MTGLHIEESFGTYRNQFSNGQFDARQFWQAEARQSLNVLQQMQAERETGGPQLPEPVPKLTDLQFSTCFDLSC